MARRSSLHCVGSFSCHMQDSLVAACGIFSCGTWDLVPWPGIKPGHPHWEHGVLTAGPTGKSLFSFSLDIYPEVGLLDHMVVLFFIFWGKRPFCLVAAPVYLLTSSAQGFPFLHALANTFFFFFFFWLHWVFVAAWGLSLVALSRGCSSLWCAGFSLQWLLLLRGTGFSICGTQAQ